MTVKREMFLSSLRRLIKVNRQNQTFELNIWLQLYMFHLKKMQVIYLHRLKMELQIYIKKKDFFFNNLETCSQIPVSEWKARLNIFHCTELCLANIAKYIKLFAITWFDTTLHPPHALFQPRQCKHIVSCIELHVACGLDISGLKPFSLLP